MGECGIRRVKLRVNKRNRRYTAHIPTDLIGWEVTVVDFIQNENVFILTAVKNDTKETRTVYADIEAIPIASMERFRGKR